MSAFILLVSGPSGAGKSTLLSRLFAEFKDELYFSISSTTRTPREGEKDGIHYHFISEKKFENEIKAGNFLEYAKVHQNYYGTSLAHTNEALLRGKNVVFDIDVQGFKIAKEKIGEKIISIFITTSNLAELEKRLISRKSDQNDALKTRLKNANAEMSELEKYDFLIINENLEQSYEALRAIYLAQKFRIKFANCANFKQKWSEN